MSWYSKLLIALRIKKESSDTVPGFGTFLGVFVPSILMVFGVIIFLRLGWIVGVVGLLTTWTMVTFGCLIAFLTMLSMSAIATNIKVGKGGVYYLISRSLGLEVGAAIGIPLYLRQSLSIVFCVMGFSESLHDLIPTWDITTIGFSTLVVLTILAYTSLSSALKVQVAIFFIIIASLISLFTGGHLLPDNPSTFVPDSLPSIGFWTVFAIFFPAMTGIESTVSLSGDLKNPSKSLPLGTMTALLVAYIVYMAIPYFLANHVPMERLVSDPLVMRDIASVPSLIILGIWGATLSSAIGGLLGSPRTLQALAEDGVIPKILGKGFGANNEPRIATIMTFFLSLLGIYFGSVNLIAPLLTMICLICYAALNLSAGLETLIANPSWRPRFRIHWAVSIFGAALCLVTMLMIDVANALIATGLLSLIYLIARRRQISGSWDDIRNGILMFFSRFAVYRLATSEGHSKSWRPNILIFNKKPGDLSNNALAFSQAICQSKGFMTMASVLPFPKLREEEKRDMENQLAKQLQKQGIQTLVQINHAENPLSGIHQMIEFYGLGTLMPNTVVFGGMVAGGEKNDFAQVIAAANSRHCNIIIIPNHKPLLGDTSSKEIQVWWDDNSQANTDFMLVLACMLDRNPAWKKSKISLKGTVENEVLRQTKLLKFQEMGINKRLSFDTEVYVSAKIEEDFQHLLKEFSANASIIFISLRRINVDESLESYTEYLKSMLDAAQDLPPVAFVLSSKHTPSRNILK